MLFELCSKVSKIVVYGDRNICKLTNYLIGSNNLYFKSSLNSLKM